MAKGLTWPGDMTAHRPGAKLNNAVAQPRKRGPIGIAHAPEATGQPRLHSYDQPRPLAEYELGHSDKELKSWRRKLPW